MNFSATATVTAVIAAMVSTGIATRTGMVEWAGITATGAARNGSSRASAQFSKRGKSRRIPAAFWVFAAAPDDPGILPRLAGHRGVALLNDALLRRLSGPVPGA